MQLSFHGADRDVTGSCHLLECGPHKMLIDCGLFQGVSANEVNFQEFGFDPASIDFVFLTHAHLDHCGRLPLLYKRGFRGEVICTSATKELARLVLLDSAHVQEADAKFAQKRAARRGHHLHLEPLYGLHDVLNCFDYFGRVANYHQKLKITDAISIEFLDAGHILGSAILRFELHENGQQRSIIFSGDLGSCGRKWVRDPEHPKSADFLVMESTYGDRNHRPLTASLDEFYTQIKATLPRGNVVIPSFALERSQEILWYLREGVERGLLPASMHVFLDSPMAISATEIFIRHPECYDEETAKFFIKHPDPFALPHLHFTRDLADSMAINQVSSGAVILAGSGMCNGGRVVHHLKHHLWREHAHIIFVGFAAKGTLARKIIDGAKSVHLLGEDIAVNASVSTINGFSAHADQGELSAWHAAVGARHTFLVHGEVEVMEQFASILARQTEAGKIDLPREGQVFDLLAESLAR